MRSGRRRTFTMTRKLIFELLATEPDISAAEITRRLRAPGVMLGDEPAPTVRTVQRICGEFAELPAATDDDVPTFWPESFGTSDLPFEASRLFFDACRVRTAARPSLRWMRLLWKMHCAAPDLPLPALVTLTSWASDQTDQRRSAWRDVESLLVGHRVTGPKADTVVWETKPAPFTTDAEMLESLRAYALMTGATSVTVVRGMKPDLALRFAQPTSEASATRPAATRAARVR